MGVGSAGTTFKTFSGAPFWKERGTIRIRATKALPEVGRFHNMRISRDYDIVFIVHTKNLLR
jgi:hypothetical protein